MVEVALAVGGGSDYDYRDQRLVDFSSHELSIRLPTADVDDEKKLGRRRHFECCYSNLSILFETISPSWLECLTVSVIYSINWLVVNCGDDDLMDTVPDNGPGCEEGGMGGEVWCWEEA